MQASFWKRHRALRWITGIVLTALAVLTVVVSILARRTEPYLRARIVDELSTRFHAKVELDHFSLWFGNGFRGEWGVWARGRGLRVWPSANAIAAGVPNNPVISLEEFRFHAPLRYKPGVPIHISEVRLNGLQIHLPPKPHELHLNVPKPASAAPGSSSSPLVSFRIDRVIATNSNLVHETDKPGKLPLDFAISYLLLKNFTPGGAMQFEAQLTNPRPEGVIHTTGTFGPWVSGDPGDSPVAGNYRFENANLATFKEIAGTLNSDGHYEGTLNNIDATGETDTPDFQLPQYGHAMHLRTQFHATVDGTNGDTWLKSVDATLGESRFNVTGKVVRVLSNGANPHSIGHDIDLRVIINNGRIEDFTNLATHGSEPLLTGVLNLDAKLNIPPGEGKMHDRLQMKGEFVLDDAEFTNPGVQGKLKQLSLRGQGKPDELKSTDPMAIPAHLEGYFDVATGKIAFPSLQFRVPGADIQLKGIYGLDGGSLDFIGSARMEATISKMVGGWKGFLLKPADRFFKKDGAGTSLPIHVGGTASHPDVGVDFHH